MQKKDSLQDTPCAGQNALPEQTAAQECVSPQEYQHNSQEYVANGVYYALVEHAGQFFRLGSTNPHWRKELTHNIPTVSATQDFYENKEGGVWLAPQRSLHIPDIADTGPKVAITCSGVGSIRPGMGRQLYDTFPAAREAMDTIAGFAEWDVLALLDETTMDKIQRFRWQLPYLFFVEYAQAAHLRSLGFAPQVFSGHSLGELISLCLGGMFSLEMGWKAMETRAILMDNLENDPRYDMGMMAVYAPLETVQNIITLFPELHISNHNSPSQCIVGGKKEILAEARKVLRKDRRPAMILPINMAFHHPHMRSLREVSLKHLRSFDVQEYENPIFSNVTADLYPKDKEGIAQYIVDLDENTVRWVDCVHNMWQRFGVRHFVELGPSDVVSNLTKEIMPQAMCMSVAQKNDEVGPMRAVTAQLYALGHLPLENIVAVAATYGDTFVAAKEEVQVPSMASQDSSKNTAATAEQEAKKESEEKQCLPSYIQDILPILAENIGMPEANLRPHMDLRHDLAVRSVRFPAMLLAFEQVFDIQVQFEDIMHVATVQDLALVVRRLREQKEGKEGIEPSLAVSPTMSAASSLVGKFETCVQEQLLTLFPSYIRPAAQDFLKQTLVAFSEKVLVVEEPWMSSLCKDHAKKEDTGERVGQDTVLWVKDVSEVSTLLQQGESAPQTLFLTAALFVQDMASAWKTRRLFAEQFLQQRDKERAVLYPVQRHFSMYHPACTPFVYAKDNISAPVQYVGIKNIVHTVYAAVAEAFPWLTVYGLDAVALDDVPYCSKKCVDGVTREAFGFVWLSQQARAEGAKPMEALKGEGGIFATKESAPSETSREDALREIPAQDVSLCGTASQNAFEPAASSWSAQCVLSVRNITDNGRRTDQASHLATGQVLLRKNAQIDLSTQGLNPLWDVQSEKKFYNLSKAFAKQEGLWHSPQSDFTHAWAWCVAALQDVVREHVVTLQNDSEMMHDCGYDMLSAQNIGKAQYIARIRHAATASSVLQGPLRVCWRPCPVNSVTSFIGAEKKNWSLVVDGHVYDAQGTLLITIEKMCFAR